MINASKLKAMQASRKLQRKGEKKKRLPLRKKKKKKKPTRIEREELKQKY